MIKVYGADWCHDTKDVQKFLDENKVEYQYINVDENPEASEWVKKQNTGKERKPTISIGDKILSSPSEEELKSALKLQGVSL